MTLTRVPAPHYGDQSAELLAGGTGVTVAEPILIIRYGANLMALTIEPLHNGDAWSPTLPRPPTSASSAERKASCG